MSIAGIRSNRGDGYQTLVALDWTLTVLSDPDYQWIEVDSVTYSVDDIVIGKSDGSVICCQCKKNQTDFKYWTVANLADELEKAAELLNKNNHAHVRFYSRSPFGTLAKLREHSIGQNNEQSYQQSLSDEHQRIDAALAKVIAKQSDTLSTYDFLCHTVFEVSPEMDRMQTGIHERLRLLVSNPRAAFNTLWTTVDQFGSRLNNNSVSAPQHRLNKKELKTILEHSGSILAPSMDVAKLLTSFISTSAIGRSWQREIAGRRIRNPVVSKILEAIESGKRSILLTGLPGSGKTCAMLEIQETLEQKARKHHNNVTPLFIQAREFADATSDTPSQRHNYQNISCVEPKL